MYEPHMRQKYIQSLMGQSERRRLLERSRGRCEDDTKMDLTEIGCQGVDWIHLAQDREK
jgi:hypothetical protein